MTLSFDLDLKTVYQGNLRSNVDFWATFLELRINTEETYRRMRSNAECLTFMECEIIRYQYEKTVIVPCMHIISTEGLSYYGICIVTTVV